MSEVTRRRAFGKFWIVGWLTLILLVVLYSIPSWTGGPQPAGRSSAAGGEEAVRRASLVEPQDKFPVTIRRPSGPPLIELQQSDPLGRVGLATCSTCHGIREANLENRKPSDLKQFHQNMPLAHGELACYACHNPSDADTLRLADSTALEYSDVMALCAQCHGTQARDYKRGAHGGMSGYWDLSRGPRIRNNCIDCHDPHVPEFPTMQPTFKPRDRFLKPPASHAGVSHKQLSHGEVDRE